jgi:uncharacterized protein
MVNEELTEKSARLQALLRSYGRVAVAYSGGVDSSLLLRMACDSLGPDQVTALHGVSCLIPEADQQKAAKAVSGAKGMGCGYRAVKLSPLEWPEFVANTQQRCYFCKKRMYGALLQELTGDDQVLLDGTNSDDLQTDRPGLAAIREFSIQTPLAMAGLNKGEIRALARHRGLANCDQPSESCLASRILAPQRITAIMLRKIMEAEQFLHQKGFPACRVQPGMKAITIQAPGHDLEKISADPAAFELADHLLHLGFPPLPLDFMVRDHF